MHTSHPAVVMTNTMTVPSLKLWLTEAEYQSDYQGKAGICCHPVAETLTAYQTKTTVFAFSTHNGMFAYREKYLMKTVFGCCTDELFCFQQKNKK